MVDRSEVEVSKDGGFFFAFFADLCVFALRILNAARKYSTQRRKGPLSSQRSIAFQRDSVSKLRHQVVILIERFKRTGMLAIYSAGQWAPDIIRHRIGG